MHVHAVQVLGVGLGVGAVATSGSWLLASEQHKLALTRLVRDVMAAGKIVLDYRRSLSGLVGEEREEVGWKSASPSLRQTCLLTWTALPHCLLAGPECMPPTGSQPADGAVF